MNDWLPNEMRRYGPGRKHRRGQKPGVPRNRAQKQCPAKATARRNQVNLHKRHSMRRIARPLLLVTLALLVPVIPFVIAGDRLEAWTLDWLDSRPEPWLMAAATAAILASDILLPVPSSLVSTLAGAQLGVLWATIASWIGLTAGGAIGFGLARRCGRPLVRRFSADDDLEAVDRAGLRHGVWMLAATRPLPVLAEATVLLLGTTDMPWRRFLPTLAFGNLGLAAAYAVLGSLAWQQSVMPLALVASIALPLSATALVRWQWTRPNGSSPFASRRRFR
jgi:uncharacterized membrane protein YdjX (TVP38/TMEM64 family)